MERFAGAISSPADEAFDFERVWRDGKSISSSRVRGRSLSISESDVMAVDVEAMEGDRRVDLHVRGCVALNRLLPLFPFSLLSEKLDERIIFDVFFFRRGPLTTRFIWYKGAANEKRPSSS